MHSQQNLKEITLLVHKFSCLAVLCSNGCLHTCHESRGGTAPPILNNSTRCGVGVQPCATAGLPPGPNGSRTRWAQSESQCSGAD